MTEGIPWSTRSAAVSRARELRRAPSPPEALLWRVLRSRPGELKFRRQHPLGPYAADFYCAAAKLVIEVDGDAHDMGDDPEKDARRDERLREQGFATIRFNAADVMKDVESVVTAILQVARR